MYGQAETACSAVPIHMQGYLLPNTFYLTWPLNERNATIRPVMEVRALL